MLTKRPAAVAGSFYPADPVELREEVLEYLQAGAHMHAPIHSRPKAIIVPHAGYMYSGSIAGTAYAQIRLIADSIQRVVLVGPAHHVGFHGLAVSGAGCFETPLGSVSLDTDTIERLRKLPQVDLYEEAHAPEHSLEVQLPFLQLTLGDDFVLVPLAVGMATTEEVAEALDLVWGGDETLIVVSSDLSHYHDYSTAQRLDEATSRLIESRDPQQLTGENACGYAGIRGLLRLAESHSLRVTTLDVRNSGDTAGPRDRVVGYGAYVVHR